MAQYELGVCYASGEGVEINMQKAIELWLKSAEQGYAAAQYNLGMRYLRGRGVEQDMPKAVSWFRKAADQGVVDAQFNLGACYYMGHGVKQDYKKSKIRNISSQRRQGYRKRQLRHSRYI